MLWDPADNTDRFQMFQFAEPLRLASFTLQGPMNPDIGSSGRGRFGEVWGIPATIPEPGTLVLVSVGMALLFRRRK